jgi:hypothetical protein
MDLRKLALGVLAFGLIAGAASAQEYALVRGPEKEPFRITFSGGGWGDKSYDLNENGLLAIASGNYDVTVTFGDGTRVKKSFYLSRGTGIRDRANQSTYWCLFVGGDDIILDATDLCVDLVDLNQGYQLN